MVDIREITRMNDLTKELQRQGLASSADEGSAMAKEFVQKGEHGSSGPVDIRPVDISRSDRNAVFASTEHWAKRYDSELSEVKRQLRTMTAELSELRKSLKGLTPSMMTGESVPPPSVAQQPAPAADDMSQAQQKKAEEPLRFDEKPAVQHVQNSVIHARNQEDHPKQGKFKPEDVSIHKMFYFGKK